MCTYQFLRKSYMCVNLVKFQQEFDVITNSLLSMFSVTRFDCISKPNENFDIHYTIPCMGKLPHQFSL